MVNLQDIDIDSFFSGRVRFGFFSNLPTSVDTPLGVVLLRWRGSVCEFVVEKTSCTVDMNSRTYVIDGSYFSDLPLRSIGSHVYKTGDTYMLGFVRVYTNATGVSYVFGSDESTQDPIAIFNFNHFKFNAMTFRVCKKVETREAVAVLLLAIDNSVTWSG